MKVTRITKVEIRDVPDAPLLPGGRVCATYKAVYWETADGHIWATVLEKKDPTLLDVINTIGRWACDMMGWET